MGLNRRNAIIGIGALAGGAGLITATGAFDAVEADRSFEVEVSGDAGALLGLTPVNDAIAGLEEDAGAGGNDVLFFQLNDEEVEETALNENAVTDFFSVFTIANNGSQDDIEVTIDTGEADGISFTVPENPARDPEDVEVNNDTILDGDADLEGDGVSLDQGEAVVVDLSIDTTEDGYVAPSDRDENQGEPYDMTITAQSSDVQE